MENLLKLFAAQTEFEDVVTLTAGHKNDIGPLSGSLSENFDFTLSRPCSDKIAETLVPQNYLDYYPLRSKGDGNCLFNSISTLICGSEKLAVELRLRTVVELTTYFDYYADHSLVRNAKITAMSKRASLFTTESIYDTVIFGQQAHKEYATTGDFYAAVKKEIMLTAVNYQYSGLLQIMGLASVIERDIKTVYPDQKSRFLPILQTTVQPRLKSPEIQSSEEVLIMWSNIQGWKDGSKAFWVNHFVPLIRQKSRSFPAVRSNTASKTSNTDWEVYVTKRKRRGSNQSTIDTSQQQLFENRFRDLVEDKDTDLLEKEVEVYENIEKKPFKKVKLKEEVASQEENW